MGSFLSQKLFLTCNFDTKVFMFITQEKALSKASLSVLDGVENNVRRGNSQFVNVKLDGTT